MNAENDDYLNILTKKLNISMNTLFFEITDMCNRNCKHCYNNSNSINYKLVSMEQFTKIIKEFIEYGIDTVILSGGEALLHPEIWNFIHKLYEYNLKIILLTNGRLLSDEVISKLKFYHVSIQISLDGATQQSNDYIRQKGSYNDIIEALKRLQNVHYEDKTSINTVLTNINHHEIKDIISLVSEFGISSIGFSFLNTIGRAKENNELELSDIDLLNVIKEINNISKQTTMKIKNIDITKNCRFLNLQETLFLTPVVDVNGNVYMCEYLRSDVFVIGNIFQETLKAILQGQMIRNNLLLLNIRQHFISNCSKCSINTQCNAGCIMQTSVGNLFHPAMCKTIKKKYLFDLGEKHDS